jgi:chromosome segregation ATPase
VANQSEIDDHIATVEKAERERADLQNELSRLEDELFFAEHAYRDKSEELEELKRLYATTKDDLDNVSEQIRQNEREIEQTNKKLYGLDSKKNSLLEFIEQLKQQIVELRNENNINFDFVSESQNNDENSLDDAEIERLALLQLQQEGIVSASTSNISSVFPQSGSLSDGEIEKMALRQILEEENSSKINLNPARLYNGLFKEVGEELYSLKTAAEKVSAGIQEGKHFANSFFTTASNLWPSAGQEALLDTMYQAEIVAGMEPQATGDFLGDAALQNLKKQFGNRM